MKFTKPSHKFVVFEGIDGVGKTTLAETLSRRLRERGETVHLIHGLSEPFKKIEGEIKFLQDVSARYFFYLASNFATSENVKELLGSGWVICVRYIYSTQAYHIAKGLHHALDLSTLEVLPPNYVFLIKIQNDKLRRQRIMRRGVLSFDDMEAKYEGSLMERVEGIYDTFGLTEIDNSQSDSVHAVNQIWQKLFPVGLP